ncbi:MAG TPA: hypothetical protein VER03_19465, partial [Bryobacteraceae bacterium]|nr:hypothetical protein [Bryobacteraceae bacterium]
ETRARVYHEALYGAKDYVLKPVSKSIFRNAGISVSSGTNWRLHPLGRIVTLCRRGALWFVDPGTSLPSHLVAKELTFNARMTAAVEQVRRPQARATKEALGTQVLLQIGQ